MNNIRLKSSFVFVVFMLLGMLGFSQQKPYQNPNLSPEERAEDLVNRLTLEEKASLMFDVSEAIPRLGIKKFNWWSEALHGFANNDDVEQAIISALELNFLHLALTDFMTRLLNMVVLVDFSSLKNLEDLFISFTKKMLNR